MKHSTYKWTNGETTIKWAITEWRDYYFIKEINEYGDHCTTIPKILADRIFRKESK